MGRLERGKLARDPFVHWCDGQICTIDPTHLVARRDGRSDTCVCPDPRSDNGYCRRLLDVPYVPIVGICTAGDNVHHGIGCNNSILCGDRWFGSNGYQTRYRIFNLFTAGLYVRGRWCWDVFCRHVPPFHTRFL